MDARKLMIGDWVYNTYHRKNIQWSYDEMFCPNGNPVIGKDLEPILLTSEILEKNGWKKHATYGTEEDGCIEVIYMLYQHSFEVVFNNKEAISIRHFVSEEDDGYDKLLIEHRDNGYKPMYVHTLQHAFLFFGFDDLADNFKI